MRKNANFGNMKRFLSLIPLLLLAACGPKWQETEADGYRLITQKGGATLGVSTAHILQDGGYAARNDRFCACFFDKAADKFACIACVSVAQQVKAVSAFFEQCTRLSYHAVGRTAQH